MSAADATVSWTGVPASFPSVGRAHLHPLRPAAHRGDAGAGDLDDTELAHQVDEGVDLVGGAGDFEDEAFHRAVDDAGAEDVGEAQRLDALGALALHLDEG